MPENKVSGTLRPFPAHFRQTASIVAKVSRDRLMEMYHRQFPQYNFLRNKGYGTREHREAILKFGRSKIHRRSFRVAGIDSLPVNEKLQL